jgi:hypothetical protein
MFNLDNYEDVNSRIKRFRAEFKTGRLEAYIEDIDLKAGYILIKALAYRNYEDEKPAAIDYAFEIKATHGVNANFFVENCVTSAYGRVIGALTPSDTRSTKQDMEKVERLEVAPVNIQQARAVGLTSFEIGRLVAGDTSVLKTEKSKEVSLTFGEAINDLATKLGAEVIGESPKCEHGHRLRKDGVSEKTKKPYLGFVCSEKKKDFQCVAIWYKEYAGKWLSPEDYALALEEAGR